MNIRKQFLVFTTIIFFTFFSLGVQSAELKVGRATCDITPSKSIALDGQMHTRISKQATTPITANILAFEGELDGKASQAIVVSLDLVAVRLSLDSAVRDAVKKVMPQFDVNNLILSATHTHTSGVTQDDKYYVPENVDYMLPSEFVDFVAEKVAAGAKDAWSNRQPVKFSYGLGYAVVAYCRRTVYANGTGVMYGNTNDPNFRRMESMEDHDIGTMFFWDKDDNLLAMIVNVSCPSQEVEGLSEIHADFWHQTRNKLREKYGKDLTVVALTGASGEQSPHTMYRQKAEERMRQLRNISRLDEIARRIVHAVDESYDVAQNDKKTDVPFRHEYSSVALPFHKITKAEYDATVAEANAMKPRLEKEPNLQRLYDWTQTMVGRYEEQQKGEHVEFPAPIHVLRIGDTATMTNSFELFGVYGIQMKARSKATQTFVVQLTDAARTSKASSGYLPTSEAYQHGGYSAIVKSITVGPEGGQKLVEETLKIVNSLFQ